MNTLLGSVAGVLGELQAWQATNVVPSQHVLFGGIVQRLQSAHTAASATVAAAESEGRVQIGALLYSQPAAEGEDDSTQSEAIDSTIEPETPAREVDDDALTQPNGVEPPVEEGADAHADDAPEEAATSAEATEATQSQPQPVPMDVVTVTHPESTSAAALAMAEPSQPTASSQEAESLRLDWESSEMTQRVPTQDSGEEASQLEVVVKAVTRRPTRTRKSVAPYDPSSENTKPQFASKKRKEAPCAVRTLPPTEVPPSATEEPAQQSDQSEVQERTATFEDTDITQGESQELSVEAEAAASPELLMEAETVAARPKSRLMPPPPGSVVARTVSSQEFLRSLHAFGETISPRAASQSQDDDRPCNTQQASTYLASLANHSSAEVHATVGPEAAAAAEPAAEVPQASTVEKADYIARHVAVYKKVDNHELVEDEAGAKKAMQAKLDAELAAQAAGEDEDVKATAETSEEVIAADKTAVTHHGVVSTDAADKLDGHVTPPSQRSQAEEDIRVHLTGFKEPEKTDLKKQPQKQYYHTLISREVSDSLLAVSGHFGRLGLLSWMTLTT